MNKHLLETKLRSIQHYLSEIEKLRKAIEVNEEVIKEIENSLAEFFPFSSGDIIFSETRKRMYVMAKIKNIVARNQGVFVTLEVFTQVNGSGFSNHLSSPVDSLEEWNKFKKIGNNNQISNS